MTPWAEDPPTGSPLPKIADHVSLWSRIEQRLGHDAASRIRTAWRDNWIVDSDFQRIADMGCNCVRLPFLDSLFDEPGGMSWLDRAIAMAKRHDLYVVLDLHGVSGGQSGEHHTGQQGRNRLWFDVENIPKTVALWKKIAAHFANEPAVALYDLMNEPAGAPNPAMLHLVYDKIVRGIREVAPLKVVTIDDGFKGFETTPHPNLAGWTQIAFSLHFYDFDAKTAQQHLDDLAKGLPKIVELQGYRDAPVYIGEFNLEPNMDGPTLASYLSKLNEAGFSWTYWTYKAVGKGGPLGSWGIFQPTGAVVPIDPFVDDETTMIAKIKGFRTDRMSPRPDVVEAIKSHTR